MTAKGTIQDADSRLPLEGANIELWYNNLKLASGTAADGGRFNVYTTSGNPNLIKITHVGYKPYSSPMTAGDDGIEYGYNMVKDVKELDPVVVVSTFVKKNPGLAIAALVGVVLLLSNKK